MNLVPYAYYYTYTLQCMQLIFLGTRADCHVSDRQLTVIVGCLLDAVWRALKGQQQNRAASVGQLLLLKLASCWC